MKEEKPRTFDYEAPYRPNSFGVILGVTLVSPTQPSHPPSPRTRKEQLSNPLPQPTTPPHRPAVARRRRYHCRLLDLNPAGTEQQLQNMRHRPFHYFAGAPSSQE